MIHRRHFFAALVGGAAAGLAFTETASAASLAAGPVEMQGGSSSQGMPAPSPQNRGLGGGGMTRSGATRPGGRRHWWRRRHARRRWMRRRDM